MEYLVVDVRAVSCGGVHEGDEVGEPDLVVHEGVVDLVVELG